MCCVANLAHKQRKRRSTLLFHHHPDEGKCRPWKFPLWRTAYGGGCWLVSHFKDREAPAWCCVYPFFYTSRTRFEGLSSVRTFFPRLCWHNKSLIPQGGEESGGSPIDPSAILLKEALLRLPAAAMANGDSWKRLEAASITRRDITTISWKRKASSFA